MAIHKFYNAYVKINTVDLSDHVVSVVLNDGFDELESTAMSNLSHRFLGGLESWSVDVTFRQDYASGKVDETVGGAKGTVVAIELRPDAGSVGPTNPKWTGNALVSKYQPMGGSVGEIHNSTCHLAAGGDLTRGTS